MTEAPTPKRPGRAQRLILIAGVLLLAGLLAIPASSIALAASQPQTPPPTDELTLLNQGENLIERKKKGNLIARPLFDRQVDVLYHAVRHPDTGEWLIPMIRVIGGEKKRKEGWEYSFEYPDSDDHPDLDPELPYMLVILAGNEGEGDLSTFYAVIPVHQPGGLWDKVLGALSPARWARAAARWLIEGAHGTLCGVVEKVSGEDIPNCRMGS